MSLRFEHHGQCEAAQGVVKEQLGEEEDWGVVREYRAGALLWRGTDLARKVYLLEAGRVEVSYEGVVVQVVREGEMFGEVCFCERSRPPHGVTARAKVKSVVREVEVTRVGKRLMERVVARFCDRLSKAEARNEVLAVSQGEERVMRALRYLSGGRGVLTMGQAELAEFVGMTRPHTTVVLTRLRREGRIEYRRGGPIRLV